MRAATLRCARGLGAVCAQLGPRCAHCTLDLVLTQCTVYSHCLEHFSWTLFKGGGGGGGGGVGWFKKRKKKEYKNFKNFLVYDLIYGIFILHYL